MTGTLRCLPVKRRPSSKAATPVAPGCEVDRKFIDIAVRRLVETDVPDPHPE